MQNRELARTRPAVSLALACQQVLGLPRLPKCAAKAQQLAGAVVSMPGRLSRNPAHGLTCQPEGAATRLPAPAAAQIQTRQALSRRQANLGAHRSDGWKKNSGVFAATMGSMSASVRGHSCAGASRGRLYSASLLDAVEGGPAVLVATEAAPVHVETPAWLT